YMHKKTSFYSLPFFFIYNATTLCSFYIALAQGRIWKLLQFTIWLHQQPVCAIVIRLHPQLNCVIIFRRDLNA
ncbi:MAG: hypothetical protein RSF86_00595, partial [Angelakisella sp.]